MPAPTKPFTVVADGKIDADSPITEELLTWLRDNIINIRERLGIQDPAGTESTYHTHAGRAVDGTDPVATLVPFPFLALINRDQQLTWAGTAGVYSNLYKLPLRTPPGFTKIVVRIYARSTSSPLPNMRLQLIGGATDNGTPVAITVNGGVHLLYTLEVTASASNKAAYCSLAIQFDRVGTLQRNVDLADFTTDQLITAHFE